MNAKMIALIAAAALSAPLATTAMARDYPRYDRGHEHCDREQAYAVSYHIDGSRRRHADCHRSARRLAQYLESLGADAHLDGDHEVHYHMHGCGRRTFYSHRAAHEFASSLRRLGFHVDIVG